MCPIGTYYRLYNYFNVFFQKKIIANKSCHVHKGGEIIHGSRYTGRFCVLKRVIHKHTHPYSLCLYIYLIMYKGI